MLATRRYDYVEFDAIRNHPLIVNHRPVHPGKVKHYSEDILRNGLLEPLVVWERNPGEFYLVGGFHRLAAIRTIRSAHPGYFDRVDVRVVSGDVEEMRALNLKLNADRLDAKTSDYFDTVIFLNNANWDRDRIAAFLDRSPGWIDEIVRYVPSMDPRLRKLLDEGKVSWNKARAICKEVLAAEPGMEREAADRLLAALTGEGPAATAPKPRRLTVHGAARKLQRHIKDRPAAAFTVTGEDLYALLLVLAGKAGGNGHLDRARDRFPALFE